jgi:hypothetical protein
MASVIRRVFESKVGDDRNEFVDDEWQNSRKSNMCELLNVPASTLAMMETPHSFR